MTKKNITILSIVIFIIFGISVSFFACKKMEELKKEDPLVSNEITNLGNGSKETGYCYLCILEKGWKGEGSSPNKICVPGKHRCWIWFQEVEILKGKCNIIGIVNDIEISSTNDVCKITLLFKYNDNDEIKLEKLFEDNLFIVEEDVVEGENSFLSELRGGLLPSKIPAGAYSITKDTNGIKVVLPITNN